MEERIQVKVETAGKIFEIRNSRPTKDMVCEGEIKGYKVTTIRMPTVMYRRLCEIANMEEVTVSEVVRRALIEYFKQYEE